VGNVFHHLETVDSTNQFAHDLLASKSKPTDGTVIFSANQSAGRGQIGSSWESEPEKNIAVSFIFFPKMLETRHQWRLNEAISLGVHDFLAGISGVVPKIKWPNDLYVNNKKIGGILIQNALGGGANRFVESSIVGIGLNVNQTFWQTNPPNPTSIFLETGENFDPLFLVKKLCKSLEIRYLQFQKNQNDLSEMYQKNLYRLNEWADFETAEGQIFSGKITGVDEIGRLQIFQNEELKTVWNVKEIRFLT
jgi:BirA family transcriptional regulator, biotin operon repressor / biotin---[acetyl-CoA-carboxylase] ligase